MLKHDLKLFFAQKNLLISHLIQGKSQSSYSGLQVVYNLPIQLPTLLTTRPCLLLSLLFTILQLHWTPCCFPDILSTPHLWAFVLPITFAKNIFPQIAIGLLFVISVRANLHKISTPFTP